MTTQTFKITTWAQLRARPIDEPADLLGGWLYAGETAMLWAAPGVGKSMMALSVALAVAGGGEFLGMVAPQARKVLFVDGEMTAQRIKQRLGFLEPGIGGDFKATGENLLWFARKDQKPGTVFPDIADADGRKALLAVARLHQPALVILDNFQSLASVEDENVTTAFNETEHLMMELQRLGAATLMVHHANKNGSGYRGTSKMGGVFDSVVGLRRLEDVPAGQAGFSITVEKDRNGASGGSLPSAAVLGGGRWEIKVDEGGTISRVVAALRSLNFPTQQLIADSLGVDKSTVSRSIAKAEARGLLRPKEADQLLQHAASLARGDDLSPDF